MKKKAIHGITVAHFHETYREKLKMELVTGEGGLHAGERGVAPTPPSDKSST